MDHKNSGVRKEKFSLRNRGYSFRHAIRGIRDLIRVEHNAWIHMAAAIFVILLGIWLRLREAQWVTVILAMGLVLAAEAFNTCVEKICDLVNPQKDERVRFIKDVSAAAVLLASLTAATVGLIIFFPLLVHHHF